MLPTMNRELLTLEPSGIRRFTALAKATPGCAMLTIGEPDFDTPEPIKAACKRALDENKTHYPQNAGDAALRRAICDFERAQNGYDYAENEVIVTHGATEALFVAMRGVLNPGDEVIIPTPAFGLYESIAMLAGAVPVPLDTACTDFQVDEAALRSAITPKTKLLVLNSPNNPTGVVYTQATLEGIRRAVKDKPIFVLCDDVYSRLVYAPCPLFAQFREMREQLLVVQSFSKPYAMTGWRMGYLMGDARVMEKLLLYHAATVVSVASYAQDACIEALRQEVAPMVETYRARRDRMLAGLAAMDLPAARPEGAFYVFPSIARFGLTAEEFCTRAITEGRVAAVPGSCFGAEGFIRLSYCYALSEIDTALERLAAFVKTLPQR